MAKHHIGHYHFQLNFSDQEIALQQHAYAEEYIKTKWLQIIENVFDELDIKNAHIRIDKLELDLGTFPLTAFWKEEIGEQLKKSLYWQLKKQLDELRFSSNTSIEIIENKVSQIQVLEQFLRSGSLNWWISNTTFNFNNFFVQVLSQQSLEVIALLKKYAHLDSIRKRLARQLNEQNLEKLVAQIEPANAQFIKEYIADIQKSHQKEPVVKASPTEFKEAVWEFVLAYLLLERGTSFNRKAFVKRNLELLAARYQSSYKKLITFLEKIAKKILQFQKSSLFEIISELKSELPTQKQEEEIEKKADFEQEIAFITIFLEKRKESSLEVFFENWTILFKKSPEKLKELIIEKGKSAMVRKKMADIFTEKQLEQSIRLIEPSNANYIISYVQETAKKQEKQQLVKANKKAFHKSTWEFILTYLLVDRGSTFNKKSFLKSTLRQMAQRYQIRMSVLVENLLSTIEQKTEKMAIFSEILLEIRQEIQKNEVFRLKQPAQMPEQSQTESVLFFLNYGFFKEKNAGLEAILENFEEQNWQELVSYYQKNTTKSHFIYRLFEQFSEKYIAIFMQKVVPKNTILLESFKKMEEQSPQKVYFYRLVLQDIAKNQHIDLEKAFIESLQKPQDWLQAWKNTKDIGLVKKLLDQETIFVSYFLENISQSDKKIIVEKLDIDEQKKLLFSTHRQLSFAFLENSLDKKIFESILPFFLEKDFSRKNMENIKTQLLDNKHFINYIETSFNENIDFWENFLWTFFEKKKLLFPIDEQKIIQLFIEKNTERFVLFLEKLPNKLQEQVLKTYSLQALYRKKYRKNATLFLVKRFLKTGKAVFGISVSELEKIVQEKISQSPKEIVPLLLKAIQNKYIIKTWSNKFLSQVLQKIFYAVSPSNYQKINDLIHYIQQAYFMSSLPQDIAFDIELSVELFAYSVRNSFNFDDFTEKIVSFLAKKINFPDYEIAQSLKEHLSPAAPAAIEKKLNKIKQSKSVAKSEKTVWLRDEPFGYGSKHKEYYINNSGLVILAPYFLRYFGMVGLKIGKNFRDETSANRAVHLLEYLATKNTQSPENELILNKILCGLPIDYPVTGSIDITEKEIEISESLLGAVVANWSILKDTSNDGLREGFLRREGKIIDEDSHWSLKVDRKTLDILLDHLSWQIGIIQTVDMPKILYVDWKN